MRQSCTRQLKLSLKRTIIIATTGFVSALDTWRAINALSHAHMRQTGEAVQAVGRARQSICGVANVNRSNPGKGLPTRPVRRRRRRREIDFPHSGHWRLDRLPGMLSPRKPTGCPLHDLVHRLCSHLTMHLPVGSC